MANPLRGEVPVTVAGKEWTLVMDFNAMCEFEGASGLSATEFMEKFQDGKDFSARQLREFVRCTLLDRHPDATPQDAGRVISQDPEALMRAFQLAFPDAEPSEDVAPGEATAAQG